MNVLKPDQMPTRPQPNTSESQIKGRNPTSALIDGALRMNFASPAPRSTRLSEMSTTRSNSVGYRAGRKPLRRNVLLPRPASAVLDALTTVCRLQAWSAPTSRNRPHRDKRCRRHQLRKTCPRSAGCVLLPVSAAHPGPPCRCRHRGTARRSGRTRKPVKVCATPPDLVAMLLPSTYWFDVNRVLIGLDRAPDLGRWPALSRCNRFAPMTRNNAYRGRTKWGFN
jgi:hypothetical protein